MKAMKEKRVSFRSLLRRGLVILSLFALVFAVSCGGDDGNVTSPTEDTSGTGTTNPPPAAKTVTAISILQQPQEPSFQGCPPDLTGFIATVTWNDGTKETIADPAQFVGVPPYCDQATAGDGSTPPLYEYEFTHGVQHISGGKVEPVILAGVIPFAAGGDATLQMTGTPTQKVWYSDQPPNFAGLAMAGTYAAYTHPITKKFYAEGTRRDIQMSANYPPILGIQMVSATTAVEGKANVTVGIGALRTGGIGLGNADKEVVFNIDTYAEAIGITVDPSSTFQDYFDDETKLNVSDSANATVALLEEFRTKNSIKLNVNYTDGTSRPITFDEYIGSIGYFNTQVSQGATYTVGGVTYTSTPLSWFATSPGVGDDDGEADTDTVLRYTEREDGSYMYRVGMNYVPKMYNLQAGDVAMVTVFDIEVPVYVFAGEAYVQRKAGAGTTNPQIDSDSAAPIDISGINADPDKARATAAIDAIKAKWEVLAYYEGGAAAEMKTRSVPITAKMLASGKANTRNGALATGLVLDSRNTTTPPNGNTDYVATSVAGQVGYDYLVPVWYRGGLLSDIDGTYEGVLVNLKDVQ